jgi:CheY-like chemotaxis protein
MLLFIIDDDREDCELFCEAVLEVDASIRCITAQDGKEAIQVLNGNTRKLPDYIFLDINMPVMNGKETLTEIKKDPRFKRIPVIMYSTTSDTEEIRGYYALGAHDFLIKPHNFKKLVEALDSILRTGSKKTG